MSGRLPGTTQIGLAVSGPLQWGAVMSGPGTTPPSSLFSARFAVLGDPPCDITFAPDAALGKFGDGLGEARRSRELVGPLAADAEHLPDLGGADEFHRVASYPLTQSSVKRYSALDTVKSKEAEMYGHSIPTYGDEPADVIGEIDASANGNVILRVGRRRLHPQSSDYTWSQSAYVVLNPDEAAAMAYEMLEAVGLNTDEGLPPRVARDELQRRADEINAADRAEEFNRGERS